MSEVIGIFDGGSAVIQHKGQPLNVGVIIWRTSDCESKPVDYTGYCLLNYKESIIKNLKRIHWIKPEPHAPSAPEVETIEALRA